MKTKKLVYISFSTILILFFFINCSEDSGVDENDPIVNDSGIQFTKSGQALGNTRSQGLTTDDIDGDEDVDIVFGQLESTGGNSIYINESIIE